MKNLFFKIHDTALIVLVISFILWGFLSFCEINIKNKNPDPVYSEYNAFIVLEKITDN